jgi:hypothetical protein
MEPLPKEAMLSVPGFALARAISSFTELAGTEGWTMTDMGSTASMAMGVTSLIGSHLRVL